MGDFFVDKFSEEIWRKKYAGNYTNIGLYFWDLALRIAKGNAAEAKAFYALMNGRRFSPGGRILAFAGRPGSSVSLMNCTTHAVNGDSLEAISDTVYTIMRASSRGQGIGIDLSSLRPADAPVNNAAKTSTGAISFMEMFNSVGGTIGQEGRRAAILFSLDISHPDVWRPGNQGTICPKCAGEGCAYCDGGFIPYDFLHVKKVPGRVENANISVMISDAFMKAVQINGDWELRFDGKSGKKSFSTSRVVQAHDLFMALAKAAHESAEPGVLFWDSARAMSNSDLFGDEWKVTGLNACTEQVLDQDGVCNLGSINLAEYVLNPFTKDASFNDVDFIKDVRTSIRFLDNVLDVELEHGGSISERQRKSVEYLRRVGLGVMGLADALAMMGLRYSSEKKTIDFVRRVFATLCYSAYSESIQLAKMFGPAKVWETVSDRSEIVNKGFFNTLPDDLKNEIIKYGTRNVSLLSIAPTGSISNFFGVSSGIEPLFSHSYTRRTRMSGQDEFVDYVHPGVRLSRSMGLPDSIWPTAYEIPVKDHIMVQAVAQKFIDQAISKTLNFPASATVKDVADAYMLAWKMGFKGLAIYRDGSRSEQVLYRSEDPEEEKCPECGNEIIHKDGCKECPTCGWAACSI